MMQKLTLVLICITITTGCFNRTAKTKAPSESLLSDKEEQEMASYSVNYKNELYHYPEIISKSAPQLNLIKNKWTSTAILCSNNEIFLLIRKVNSKRFIAVSSEEINKSYSFQYYDFSIDGEIFHKSKIKNTNYSINNRFNFTIDNDSVYYYTQDNKETVFAYSLLDKVHNPSQKNKINWARINDWKNESRYLSRDKSIEIYLSDVQLIVNKKDTLINQIYDGTWSFNQGAWNLDNSKFYFDNSGAVACIWEVDLKNKTLDKIVPDHRASAPVYLFDSTDAIIYCNKNCVYITRKDK